MRMRVIKPAFWKDRRMAALPPQAQLIYVGLWMLSDDSGWSEYDAVEMAAELFPHRDPRTRLKTFEAAVALLVGAGRVQLHECGHAFIPKLAVHQKAGHPFYGVREYHRSHCFTNGKGLSAIDEDSASKGEEGKVRYSRGEESRASAGDEVSSLKARFGDFDEMISRGRRAG